VKFELSHINVATVSRVVSSMSLVVVLLVSIPILIMALVFAIPAYFDRGKLTLEPFLVPLWLPFQSIVVMSIFCIFSIVVAIIYNFVARKWGGIEITLTDKALMNKFNR
jgi:hypothetical protein